MTFEDGSARLVAALDAQLEKIAKRAVREIFTEIEAYNASDEAFASDVQAHVMLQFDTAVKTFAESREVTRKDLEFVEAPASRRVHRVALADFMHAFRIGEAVLWHVVADELATDESMREAALAFATHLMESGGFSSHQAAESYAEAERVLALTGEQIRRDLLEELLAGHEPAPGPRLDAAEAAGLGPDVDCVVVSAKPLRAPVDEHALRIAASNLAGVARTASQPLVVLRHDEIVLVSPINEDRSERFVQGLEAARSRQAEQGVELQIGVSTVHAGIAAVGAAHEEACEARGRLQGSGVLALVSLNAFEYLTLRRDSTAQRLVPPTVARFVGEDARNGGALIETLEAYVDANLQAKAAAARLHVHVNTVRYRLRKITESSGCDLRSINDLIELLIAVRFARADLGPRHAIDGR